jgi:hypothetical protein
VGVLLGASKGQGGKVDGAQVGKGIVGITVGGDVGVVDGGMEGDGMAVHGARVGDNDDGKSEVGYKVVGENDAWTPVGSEVGVAEDGVVDEGLAVEGMAVEGATLVGATEHGSALHW